MNLLLRCIESFLAFLNEYIVHNLTILEGCKVMVVSLLITLLCHTTMILGLKIYQAFCLYPKWLRHSFDSAGLCEFPDLKKNQWRLIVNFISANIYTEYPIYARFHDYKQRRYSPKAQDRVIIFPWCQYPGILILCLLLLCNVMR